MRRDDFILRKPHPAGCRVPRAAAAAQAKGEQDKPRLGTDD